MTAGSSSLGHLREERDFLIKSIEDLEAEFAAGDMERSDYEELKADYTVRTADVLRQIGRAEAPAHRRQSGTGQTSKPPAAEDNADQRRRMAWTAFLVGFALLAGLLMARTVGERGVNDQITGSIEETPRERVLRCQELGTNPDRRLESLECFDSVILEDPRNAEALSWRGWYVFLASRDAESAGATEDALELLGSAARFLDQAVEADPSFPDARAFRAVVADRLDQPEAACAELAVLDSLSPPPGIAQLTAPLAERLQWS